MTRKRQAGDFFSTGNVLPSDVGGGHLGEYVYRRPRGCTGTSLDAFCILYLNKNIFYEQLIIIPSVYFGHY